MSLTRDERARVAAQGLLFDLRPVATHGSRVDAATLALRAFADAECRDLREQLGAAEESLRICFDRLELLDATLKKETT